MAVDVHSERRAAGRQFGAVEPFRLGQALLLFGVALIVGLIAGAAFLIAQSHDRALAAAEREIVTLDLVLAEQTARAVEGIDLLLDGTIDRLLALPASVQNDPQAMRDFLAERVRVLGQVRALAVLDIQGTVLNASHDAPGPDRPGSEAPYFTLHTIVSPSGLYIDRPRYVGLLRSWVNVVSRVIVDRDGNAVGTLVAAIDPAYFINLYRAVAAREGMTVSLLRRDGTAMARYPGTTTMFEENMADTDLFRRHLIERSSGSYREAETFDQPARLIAYRALPDYPLVVYTALGETAALAEWRRDAAIIAIGTLIAVLALGAATTFLVAESTRRARSQAMLHSLTNLAPIGIFMAGRDGHVTFANEAFANMLYLAPAEVLGVGWLDGLHPGQRDRALVAWTSRLATGQSFSFDQRALRRDGTEAWFHIAGAPLRDADGELTGFVGSVADLTQRHLAETELARARALIEAALDRMALGFLVFDSDRRVLAVNRPVIEMFDMPPQLMEPGASLIDGILYQAKRGDFGPGDPVERAREALGDAERLQARLWRRRLTNGRVIEIHRSVLPDGNVVHIYSDVTEEERARARLAESERRFRDVAASVSDWVYETDADRRLSYVSERFADSYGPNYLDVLGQRIDEMSVNERDTPEWNAHEADIFARRPFRDFVSALRTPAGVRYIRFSGVPMFGPDGVFLGYRGAGTDITAARRAEMEAARARAVLETALDGVDLGLMIYDADCRVIATNRRLGILTGVPEVLHEPGTPVDLAVRHQAERGDFGPGDPEQLTRMVMATAMAPHMRRWKRRMGSRVIEIHRNILPDGTAVQIYQDITEAEEARARLEESERRFRDVADAASDWVWETDEEDRFVYHSERFALCYGPDYAKTYGKRRHELAAEDTSTPRWATQREQMAEHRPFRDFVYTIATATGPRIVRVSGLPRFGPDGRFLGYRGAGSDITAQVEAEREARSARERLFESINVLLDCFVMWDPQDRLMMCNADYAALYPGLDVVPGLPFSAVVDHVAGRLAERFDGFDSALWRRERIALHQACDGEAREMLHFDGRWFRMVERRTSEGFIVSVLTDVTQIKRVQVEASEARALAEAANLAKSEFLSRMSHELRTPLNSVLGFGQLMLFNRKDPLSDKQQEYIRLILKSGEHLLSLINEVLDLSRIEAGKMELSIEPVDIAEVVEECLSLMEAQAEKRQVTMVNQLPGLALPRALADRTRVRQAVLNLVSNAIKYNREGGQVTLSASVGQGCVRLDVADTGQGIPADRLRELFVPFSRLGADARAIEGTGIGLSLTKRLIDLMGGRIGVSSEAGTGSVFWFELPVEAADPARLIPCDLPPADGVAAIPARERPLLLYVDDNPQSRGLMQDFIAGEPGYDLLAIADGVAGYHLACERRPDLILLDLNLTGETGWQILRRLKGSPATMEIPVVALSAAEAVSAAEDGRRAGFTAMLAKPLDFGRLRQLLATILR